MSDDEQIHEFARGLYRVATIFEKAAIVFGILGVIAGLLVGMSKETELIAEVTKTTRPHAAAGFVIAMGAVINAAFLWAIARGLRLYAMDVNRRIGGVAIALPLRIDVATASYQAAASSPRSVSGSASSPAPPAPAPAPSARVWSRSAQPKSAPTEPEAE